MINVRFSENHHQMEELLNNLHIKEKKYCCIKNDNKQKVYK